jgi:hypothetical protein
VKIFGTGFHKICRENSSLVLKKGKVVLVHTMKAYKGSRYIDHRLTACENPMLRRGNDSGIENIT